MSQQVAYNVIQGGEDLATPPLTVSPTRCSLALNFECDKNGRLRRIDGYERFDGRSVSELVERASITAVPGSGPVRGAESEVRAGQHAARDVFPALYHEHDDRRLHLEVYFLPGL